MKVQTKEIVGVAAGLAFGALVLNSKNIFVLMALGVAGGLIAHNVKFKYVKDGETIIDTESEQVEDESSEFYGENKEMEFNKTIGYHTPNGVLEATEPKDFMDISFK